MNCMWFSTGVSSFIAAFLAKNEIDEFIYTHINDQHSDSLRFLAESEVILGQKITVMQSEYYRSVEDVCRMRRYINGPHGAQCTVKLKKEVRKRWEYENPGRHTYFWGLDCSERERKRAERIIESMPQFDHRFPLIENNVTKEEAHGICLKLGVKRPVMYELGYHNNNCVGCVKGGMGYWNKIRIDFPQVFAERAKMERDIGHSCIRGKFLDELKPDEGRNEKPITEECGIFCELELEREVQDELLQRV